MIIFFSTILSLILTFSISYFIFFLELPESIKIDGFISFLMTKDAFGGLIGGVIGMMALNLILIMPLLISLPNTIHSFITAKKLKKAPKQATGKILSIDIGTKSSTLDISYINHRKLFKVPNSLLTNEIRDIKNVTVFYDPSDPNNSYIDLIPKSHDAQNTETKGGSNSVFKLLELTPKFDLTPSSYELIGEIHSAKFKGQKASLVYELKNKDLNALVPGKIFPCAVSGSTDDYSIDINID